MEASWLRRRAARRCSRASASCRRHVERVLHPDRTADDHGIASFVITNNSDQSLNTVELRCWVDGDASHSRSIKVRARARSVAPHGMQQFSDVDLGYLGPARTAQCEVAGAD